MPCPPPTPTPTPTTQLQTPNSLPLRQSIAQPPSSHWTLLIWASLELKRGCSVMGLMVTNFSSWSPFPHPSLSPPPPPPPPAHTYAHKRNSVLGLSVCLVTSFSVYCESHVWFLLFLWPFLLFTTAFAECVPCDGGWGGGPPVASTRRSVQHQREASGGAGIKWF